MNSPRSGQTLINAPIAVARVPTTPIRTTNADIAATPINANGPIKANTASMPVKFHINLISISTLSIAGPMLFIRTRTPINTTIGAANAVNANTPSNACTTRLPISDNGIKHKVIAPTRIDNAIAFSIPF